MTRLVRTWRGLAGAWLLASCADDVTEAVNDATTTSAGTTADVTATTGTADASSGGADTSVGTSTEVTTTDETVSDTSGSSGGSTTEPATSTTDDESTSTATDDESGTTSSDANTSDGTSSGASSGETSTSSDPTTSETSTGPHATCGDGIVESPEVCDGDDLADATCTSEGFDFGTLSCTADCLTFDATACGFWACGNDLVEGGEICDGTDLAGADCTSQGFDAGALGCQPDCAAFDVSACVSFTCGNGEIEGAEACDADDLAGEDCLTQGFDAGTLLCLPDCTAFDTSACITYVCGDGLVEGDELCEAVDLGGTDCVGLGFDEGTLACAADCSAFDTSGCVAWACGNGLVEGDETCDGAALALEDCVSLGFEYGTLGCRGDCAAFDTSACVSCGDGLLGGAESCDAFDLGGATCTSEGFSGGWLYCDDACGYRTDECYPLVSESEPNDDGAIAVATNDFSSANADGPFTDDVLISANLAAGDDDVFAVTNPFAVPAYLHAETFGPGGVGECANPNTVLTIRDAAGVQLATDDNGGVDFCSRISEFVVAPGATVYVHVIDSGDNTALPSYRVFVRLRALGCGNRVLEAGEQCEAGDVANGDGCDSSCQIEGLVDEIEGNNNFAAADASEVAIDGSQAFTRLRGAIAVVGDADVYRIDVAEPGVLRLETFTSLGRCAAGYGTILRFYDDAGGLLAQDSAGGLGNCSALVYPVEPGTHYVSIREPGDNGTLAPYLLEAAFATDVGPELEPDDTIVTAHVLAQGVESFAFGDHAIETDLDVYGIHVPSGASLRIETIEGDLATESCESLGVDTFVTLLDPAGAVLVSNDDSGRGNCSRIDGTGDDPDDDEATALEGGLYYVQVGPGSAAVASNQFDYRLAFSIRAP